MTAEQQQPKEPYWLMPQDKYKILDDEFHFDFDPCPCPKPEGYDSTIVEWGESNFVNPPFHRENGKGPTAFVRKAIEENKKGKTVVLVAPTQSYVNLMLEAGAELRSMGRIRWLHKDTKEPCKNPSPITAFILRSRPRPAPQQPEPFVAMSSTDLIALSEKEWTNRAERKQPEYNKRSWISGWMDGYFSKPQQPPATTPACPYSAEEDMCLECKAHEERIAAKARREEREQVIGELEKLANEEERLKKESKTNEPWMGHAYAASAYLKAIAILREGAK